MVTIVSGITQISIPSAAQMVIVMMDKDSAVLLEYVKYHDWLVSNAKCMNAIMKNIREYDTSCDAAICNPATQIARMYPVNTLSHRTGFRLLSWLYD